MTDGKAGGASYSSCSIYYWLSTEVNMRKLMLVCILIMMALAVTGFAGCQSDANVASSNLSRAADQFEINRRVVFYNGITGEYMLTVEGRCSITADSMDGQLELTCKTGPESFKKHFLGLSDNVTYFVEQLEGTDVSVYRYRVIFKPETIIPDIDLETSLDDG